MYNDKIRCSDHLWWHNNIYNYIIILLSLFGHWVEYFIECTCAKIEYQLYQWWQYTQYRYIIFIFILYFNEFLFFKVHIGSRYLQYNTNTIKRGPKGVHKLILIIVLPQHRGPDIAFTTFVCGYFRNYYNIICCRYIGAFTFRQTRRN